MKLLNSFLSQFLISTKNKIDTINLSSVKEPKMLVGLTLYRHIFLHPYLKLCLSLEKEIVFDEEAFKFKLCKFKLIQSQSGY